MQTVWLACEAFGPELTSSVPSALEEAMWCGGTRMGFVCRQAWLQSQVLPVISCDPLESDLTSCLSL